MARAVPSLVSPLLNHVDLNLLNIEVGEQGQVELAQLQHWCAWDGDHQSWIKPTKLEHAWPEQTPLWVPGAEVLSCHRMNTIRLAPSIVSRNEAELFGLSMPRFALRVYLEHAGQPLGFVNVRRLATFASQAPRWAKRLSCKKRRLEDLKRAVFLRGTPANLTRKNSCIADALLRPPSRFKGWTVLTADLAAAYGEVGGDEAEHWVGTPYLRHIAFSGGGLCAQATCFMATALLHRSAKGVHGVADVTSLASSVHHDEMRLTGLTRSQLPNYFTHREVGLNAVWQQALPGRFPTAGIAFRLALRSYLQSGMPIILPVDSGRLAGQGRAKNKLQLGASIRIRNGHPPGMWFNCKKVRARNHAVLLVGTDGDDLFTFNDPATLPFLVASSLELADVGIYADFATGALRSCMFLPVTPGPVQMPLLDDPPEKHNDKIKSLHQGLLTVRLPLQDGPHKPPDWPTARHGDPGEWELLQPEKFLGSSPSGSDSKGEGVRALLNELIAAGMSREHWCWLQSTDRAIWIWDAETKPPARADEKAALNTILGVAAFRSGAWATLYRRLPSRTRPTRQPISPALEVPRTVTASLISSFCVSDLSTAIRHWPAGVEACEIYAFMQPDGDRFLADYTPRIHTLATWWAGLQCRTANWLRERKRAQERFRTGYREPFATAMQRLAAAYRSDRASKRNRAAVLLAAKLHACVQAERPLLIPAFATYFPEITSSKSKDADNARDALLFLISVARRLRDEFGHPIQTIEIVAGSRINGVWPARDLKHPHDSEFAFVANRIPVERAIKHLLDRLLPLASAAREAGISLALELEPGPLYILRDWKSVRELCETLEDSKYCELKPSLGLNLDVAHWGILKGITTAELLADEKVRERIVHSHVADHASGHFGDVTLLQHHDPAFFRDWLCAIEIIAASPRSSDASPFSRHVSLEFESCCRREMLALSVARLNSLLRDDPISY